MSSQTHSLHRSLLRPMIIHTLRAAGFQSTRPSVLDTFTSLAERYLLLLASTTGTHALNAHSDATPSLSDVRMALRDCGAIVGGGGASEEEWAEMMRVPVEALEGVIGGVKGSVVAEGGGSGMTWQALKGDGREARRQGEKRKREKADVADVTSFLEWFDGAECAEIKRIAGMSGDSAPAAGATGAAKLGVGGGAVGVGGGKIVADDFLMGLKRKQARIGAGGHGSGGGVDEARWVGTALGKQGEDREVVVEGGPVQSIREWRPSKTQQTAAKEAGAAKKESMDGLKRAEEVPVS